MSEQPIGLAALIARQAAGVPAPAAAVPDAAPVVPAGSSAWSLDAQGRPVQSGVPEDFAAAAEQAAISAYQLSPEEVAEFRALRADKKARDEEAARLAAEAAARLQAPTHHVHLADGTHVEGSAIATHYVNEDGRVVVVAGVFELEPQLA